VAHSAPGQAATGTAVQDEPSEDGDRLFLDRVRLGLRLVNAGIAAVFIGWIAVNPGQLPYLSAIQALNFLVVAAALWMLRDPRRRTFNHAVSFTAYAATIVATGLSLIGRTVWRISQRWQKSRVMLVSDSPLCRRRVRSR
jgi:hypothetical protein